MTSRGCGRSPRVVVVPATRAELRRSGERLLREAVGAVRVLRICSRCASTDHGRPVVRVARGVAPSVSLSYADDLVLVAWTWAGVIGVDVEPTGLPVGEFGDRGHWTLVEAAAKATGEGLRREPADLPVLWSRPLDLGPAWVATVAVAGVDPGAAGVEVSWRTAGPAAPAR